jgi:uncharacterized alpha-E superfamily protein
MLSSTAKNLYWLGRYLQRAESTARLLEATQRMALQSGADEAGTAADIYGLREAFVARHPDGGVDHFVEFMALDDANPSSLLCTVKAARDNARAERNNLTADVWESLNGLWLEAQASARRNRARGIDRGAFIDTVKKQAVMITGAAQSTLLRDEAYNFLLIGTFLERADNTARILDVKFHRLSPDGRCDDAMDAGYYAWSEVLACIGALRTYRRVYRSRIEPRRVVELMLLRRDLPRSVLHCLWQVDLSMRALAETYGTHGEADRQGGELHARLRYCRTEHIFEVGLRPFLEDLGERLAGLSDEIGRQFLFE